MFFFFFFGGGGGGGAGDGVEYGYANPPIRAFFCRQIRRSAKIVVQIQITSENISVKVQR